MENKNKENESDKPKKYYPMLSMFRWAAVSCVLYFHWVQHKVPSDDWRAKKVIFSGMPFAMAMLCTISGFLHSFSWRRAKYLSAAFMFGVVCNAVALIFPLGVMRTELSEEHTVLDKSGVKASGTVMNIMINLVLHLYFIPTIWLLSFLVRFFRQTNVFLIFAFVVLGLTGSRQFAYLALTHAVCFLCDEIMEHCMQKNVIRPSAAGLSVLLLWTLSGLGYVLFGETGDNVLWTVEMCLWCYVCGAKLKKTSTLTSLRQHVVSVVPYYLVAHLNLSAGFIDYSTGITGFAYKSFPQRCFLAGNTVIMMSLAMSAVPYEGWMCWSRWMDKVVLLVYLSQELVGSMFASAIFKFGIRRKDLDHSSASLFAASSFLFCGMIWHAGSRIHACLKIRVESSTNGHPFGDAEERPTDAEQSHVDGDTFRIKV